MILTLHDPREAQRYHAEGYWRADTLYLLVKHEWTRHRRVGSRVQGVVRGQLVFETEIVGVQM